MIYNIKKYFTNSYSFLSLLRTRKESFWLLRGEQQALFLFNQASVKINAYKDFLKKNHIKNKSISDISAFQRLPVTDKKNYLINYPLKYLTWSSKFPKGSWVFSATSGSTGEPFYFPRQQEQDLYYALTAELYLVTNFGIHKKNTLYINAFALGVWIGGLFTYQALKHVADKGKYDLTIVSPGVNKEEMLKAIKKLAFQYDQVIIGGYPPFIKDFVDFSIENGFDWSNLSVKFIFSAEGFSEEFRDYIAGKVGLKNVYKDTLNHYGTVDLGTMSYETPLSILIRRLALKNKGLFQDLFGQISRLPTLTQFIPEQFYFEELDGRLVCTSNSGIPLVRYDLKDVGGVKKFSEVFNIARRNGIDLEKEIKKVGIKDTIWQLPFVYVFERADFSVSLYGANIYPEHIKPVLLKNDFVDHLTGRFFLEIGYSNKQDPILFIHIELKEDANIFNDTSSAMLEEYIFNDLLINNSEYTVIYKNVGPKALPKVKIWKYQGHENFNRKGKQKWIIK